MPTLNIEGIGEVTPADPNFFNMPVEKQAEQVDQLIKSAKAAGLVKPPQNAPEAAGLDPAQSAAAENRANFVKSAGNFAGNIAQTVMHPVQTVENLGTVGKGILQKVGIISGKDAVPAADVVWQSLIDRYGSADAIKKTIHEDPVGFLADASTLLGGAGAALSRAPGIAGKVGEIASEAGGTFNPLRVAGSAVAPLAKGAGNVAAEAAGITTGAGPQAIKTAFNAGAEGGPAAAAFKEGLTGTDSVAVVNEAKAAVNQLRAERGAEYQRAMAKTVGTDNALGGKENQIIDFGKIDKAVDAVSSVKNYKGQDISPKTAAIRDEMVGAIEDWKKLDPIEFHTVEGMDALKQKLGEIAADAAPGSPASKVAGAIYNSVRQSIIDQAPDYAKIMKGYEEASNIIREIEKTLSLNPGATIDTSMRKLQSVLRNNVSTNYGRRAELVDFLSRAGAPHLMEKLSGQALSSVAPRGLSRLAATGEGASALMSLALGHPIPAAVLGTAVVGSSPSIAGHAAYGLGAASNLPLGAAGLGGFQLGRLGQQ